jgi:dTDP-4-amino-4,6-dideoxygalactose transaminase
VKSNEKVMAEIGNKYIKQKGDLHLFVVRHRDRDELQASLKMQGIHTGVHYPIALPKLKAFKYLGQETEDGFAWQSDSELLSLPIDTSFRKEDVAVVVKECIRYFTKEKNSNTLRV